MRPNKEGNTPIVSVPSGCLEIVMGPSARPCFCTARRSRFASLIFQSTFGISVTSLSRNSRLGKRDPSPPVRRQCRQGTGKRGLGGCVELHGIRRSGGVCPKSKSPPDAITVSPNALPSRLPAALVSGAISVRGCRVKFATTVEVLYMESACRAHASQLEPSSSSGLKPTN